MKVVAFNGSARKKGSTRILIDTLFDVLSSESIEIRRRIYPGPCGSETSEKPIGRISAAATGS